MAFQSVSTDPFCEPTRLPADQTPAQEIARQKREADAQRISDPIDEELVQERAKRKKNIMKVLLLGQAESGKSTVLKNFKLQFNGRAEQDKERGDWRAVIQLTVVRAVLNILKVIEAELNVAIPAANPEGDLTLPFNPTNEVEAMKFTILIIRLAPLHRVEAALNHRGSSVPEGSTTPSREPNLGNSVSRNHEFPTQPWQEILDRVKSSSTNYDTATSTFADCKGDMQSLWENRAVHLVLKKRRLQLSYSAGFFLNDLDRVASRDFVVTDDDIARVKKGSSKSIWAKGN